jgi:hypothetical protein
MKKAIKHVELVMNALEILIAVFLLAVIVIRGIEIGISLFSTDAEFQGILQMDFNSILSLSLGLIIGIEFTKMLCKHTPESVLDVLLFALARHMVIYNEKALDLMFGVAAIAGLFAAKKYLLSKPHIERKEQE